MQKMGVKRPLEEEILQELSFDHPKQLDNNKKLAYMTEDFPSHATGPEVDSPGRNCYLIPHFRMLLRDRFTINLMGGSFSN